MVLRPQLFIQLDEIHWRLFVDALDAPVRPLTRLKTLLIAPSFFEGPDAAAPRPVDP